MVLEGLGGPWGRDRPASHGSRMAESDSDSETPPLSVEPLTASQLILRDSDRFVITLHTGDRKGDERVSNVYIQLRDAASNTSPHYSLPFLGPPRQWRTRFYILPDAPGVREIDNILLQRHDADSGDAWFIEVIEVDDRWRGRQYVFPVHRWLEPDQAFRLWEYDCSLPQDDMDPGAVTLRSRELVYKREHYEYAQHVKDGPVQARQAPYDEDFSNVCPDDFTKEWWRLYTRKCPIFFTSNNWSAFSEMVAACEMTFGKPMSVQHWNTDRWFGIQRLQGVNAKLITLCTAIPDKLGVDVGMMNPFLEGLTLDEAITANRIFIVDLHILDGIPAAVSDNIIRADDYSLTPPARPQVKELCAPIALFFLNDFGHLMPVAIQLFQKKAPDNPVFLPSDPPNLWLLAKMFYNNAEAQHHQILTHLGLGRFLMEGVAVSVHRNLSPSHPVYRLLAPHFFQMFIINECTRKELLEPGRSLYRMLMVDEGGLQELMKRGLQNWRLDTCGVIPREVASRGGHVLPYYPYRDDACELYAAIERYVRAVLSPIYTNELRFLFDCELLQWHRELTRPSQQRGVGLQGVPGDYDKGFSNIDQLVDVVTAVIAACTVGHAASSLAQYDEAAGFMPNYPPLLYGRAPRSKQRAPSETELMKRLPGREATWEIMSYTYLLGTHQTGSLGDPQLRYLFDPNSTRAAEELQAQLRRLTTQIMGRNAQSEFPYPWLDPAVVPNRIPRSVHSTGLA